MTTRVSYLNPGPYPVHIGFTTSEEAFRREIKRLKIPEDVPFLGRERANATMHTLVKGSSVIYIIAMQPPTRKIGKEQYAALVAHEALHIIQDMRSELNQNKPFDKESECYLLQHIVQHCLQEAWQTGRVKRIRPQ